jgi:hypothetical protein
LGFRPARLSVPTRAIRNGHPERWAAAQAPREGITSKAVKRASTHFFARTRLGDGPVSLTVLQRIVGRFHVQAGRRYSAGREASLAVPFCFPACFESRRLQYLTWGEALFLAIFGIGMLLMPPCVRIWKLAGG